MLSHSGGHRKVIYRGAHPSAWLKCSPCMFTSLQRCLTHFVWLRFKAVHGRYVLGSMQW